MSTPRARRTTAVVGIVVLALMLRILRLLCRWDEVAWLYAAYPGRTVRLLQQGELGAALSSWVGLHPPLWPVLHGVQELVLPVPLVFLATSIACSLGAVLLALRVGPLPALLLATGPVQLHYAAEINDYPLVALLTVAAWVLREQARRDGSWLGLAVVGILATWTHPLAGLSALLAGLMSGGGRRWRVLGVWLLGALPLVPQVLGLLDDSATFRQPAFRADLVFTELAGRFGLYGLLWLLPAALGARRRPDLALAWLASGLLIGVLVALGIAAPHQFPYLLVLSGPFVLLVDAGVPVGWRWGAVVLAVAQGLQVGAYDLVRLEGVRRDLAQGERAIDLALERLEPDGAMLLISPAGINDDDKHEVSAVLWRLRPWWAMPMVVHPDVPYEDHRYGQARRVRGHVVYLTDHTYPQLDALLRRHPRTLVVVSEPGRNPEYTDDLEAMLGVVPERVGADLLFEVEVGSPEG